MAIILDADVIIRGEKGTFDLQRWVRSYPNDQFEIAAITVAELWHGVERAGGFNDSEFGFLNGNNGLYSKCRNIKSQGKT